MSGVVDFECVQWATCIDVNCHCHILVQRKQKGQLTVANAN